MNFAYDKAIVNDLLFKEIDDFSCMTTLLKLIALDRMSCEGKLEKGQVQVERRKQIMDELLVLFRKVKLNHKGSIYETGKLRDNFDINKEEMKVKNIAWFFKSLATNLNSIFDKDDIVEYLTSPAFLGQLLDSGLEVNTTFIW